MTRRGMNLRSLEAATGISRSRLSRTVNRDESPINTNELDLICDALGISPTEIIGIAEQAVRAERNRLTRSHLSLAASADRGQAADVNEEDYL